MSVIDNARAAYDEWSQNLAVPTSQSRVDRLAAALRDIIAEHERLTAWKAEAITVLSEWEETWKAAGRPGRLGSSKAVGVRDEIQRLTVPPTVDKREAVAALIRESVRMGGGWPKEEALDRWVNTKVDVFLASETSRNRCATITDDDMRLYRERAGWRTSAGRTAFAQGWHAALEAAEGAR